MIHFTRPEAFIIASSASGTSGRYESESSYVQGREASEFQIQRLRKKVKANQPPDSQRRTTEGSPSWRASADQPLASQPKPASLSKLTQEVKRFHILKWSTASSQYAIFPHTILHHLMKPVMMQFLLSSRRCVIDC